MKTTINVLLTDDKEELIAQVWERLGPEGQGALYTVVKETILPEPFGEGKQQINYTDIVRTSWCLGFAAAMGAVEAGMLVKAEPGAVGGNN